MMRFARKFYRSLRVARFVAKGVVSTDHPVLAHIIPIRRCNLSCTYCNEYDDSSKPVPTEEMLRRLDHLGRLGTTAITISGGEPLMHPELELILKHARKRRMLATMITNGYLLTRERIASLNQAGVDFLQISIDNVNPDEVSKKSLRLLDKKLEWLAEMAEFGVNINSVLGSGVKDPNDALVIAQRAVNLGFSCSVGIIHDGLGTLRPLSALERQIFEKISRMGKHSYARLNYFQKNLVEGKPSNWRCRSGARYLYICEDGLVHYCSQQRGYPGVPLAEYTREDILREYRTRKACAAYCTVTCVHQVATFDFWRDPQTL